MTNFRIGGYLVIAFALLNLRYQTGHPHVLRNSLLIGVPGVFILALTFIDSGKEFLSTKGGKVTCFVLGALAVLFAIIN